MHCFKAVIKCNIGLESGVNYLAASRLELPFGGTGLGIYRIHPKGKLLENGAVHTYCVRMDGILFYQLPKCMHIVGLDTYAMTLHCLITLMLPILSI